MTPVEAAQFGKDIVLALAALVTASAAVVGLWTWKRELKGNAEFEVARNLTKATYRLRNELAYVRAPILRGSEFPAGDMETVGAFEHLFKNRWAPLNEALSTFEATALEAEALWGEPSRENAKKLMDCVRTIHIATESFLADKVVNGENFKADQEFGRRTRAELFCSASAKDNPLSVEISQAVAAIEKSLKPHLSRR